jgi:hypothetical protein
LSAPAVQRRAGPRLSATTATALALLLYLGALVLWRERVPQGLHNDTVEEAQRAIYLVEGRHLEAITTVIGNSAETLYLYLVGASIALLGPTALAIQAVSWAFALLCVWLGARLAVRLEPRLPVWVPLVLFASSPWLFHYARCGLRAISAPVFLLAFCLLLDGAERSAERRGTAAAAGAVLGLGVYAYTACRLLPLAWLAHALLEARRAGGPRRRAVLACHARIAAAALLVSLPNLLLLIRSPRELLLRGSYVVRGGPAEWLRQTMWSFLLPLHYPAAYAAGPPANLIDGVSTSLKAAGLEPVFPLVGLAFFAGVVVAWRRRQRPAISFLLIAWAFGSVLLGFSGPSLTRLLILLPVYLVLAALAVGSALAAFPRLRPVAAAAFAALLAFEAHAYFFTFAGSAAAQSVYSRAATPIGERAAALAEEGKRVLAVTSREFNTVRYLTHGHEDRVRVIEFYRRPFDSRRLPLREFQPQVLLLENNPRFARFASVFAAARRTEHPAFGEIRLE